ncbi:MAG: amino acid ABC transporter substrate-binding protein, partial [Burkholderia sp.]|nr:amino acid ABC transporter substrate-binding protein [Burkholderia sp.]
MVPFIKRFGALAAGFATCIVLSAASASAVAAEPTLKVGATATGVPFTFLDVKSNSIQGMMVDAITAAGKSAGFRVDVQ